MKVENTNLSMIKGDTEYISVFCDNYFFQEGDILEFTVRQTPEHFKKLIYKKVSNFIGNRAEIKIEPEDTKNLAPSTYKYDIQLTLSNGDIKTIVPCSKFTILQEVTYG